MENGDLFQFTGSKYTLKLGADQVSEDYFT